MRLVQNILLGVTGGIACYKAAALTRRLREQGMTARVILTPAAARFVGAPTFQALSAHPVMMNEWDAPQSPDGMDHIAATRWADALLVAPASADFIAKAAAGIADSLLLAAFLAADCPKMLAPAMNTQMWQHPATQRNIAQLKADGVTIIGPVAGDQACGETGMGRMTQPEDIVAALLLPPATKSLAGARVLISAGATVEALDPMRVITNRSSGKMGFCLAEAAAGMGADVQLVAGQTTAPPPANIPLRRALSGKEMQAALMQEAKTADWFFSVAAVCDFYRKTPAKTKRTRRDGDWSLTLTPADDILAAITRAYPNLKSVAFAAQTGSAAAQEKAAREKMKAKAARYIALNNAADAGGDSCQITLLYPGGKDAFLRKSKRFAAVMLLAAIVSRETIHNRRKNQ